MTAVNQVAREACLDVCRRGYSLGTFIFRTDAATAATAAVPESRKDEHLVGFTARPRQYLFCFFSNLCLYFGLVLPAFFWARAVETGLGKVGGGLRARLGTQAATFVAAGWWRKKYISAII